MIPPPTPASPLPLGPLPGVAQASGANAAAGWTTALTPEMLASFLADTPYRIYSKDAAGRCTAASRAQLLRHGFLEPQELLGRTDAELLSPEQAARTAEAESGIRRTGIAIVGEEERIVWPDGTERWARTVSLPQRDAQGAVVGTCGYSEDITLDHEAQQALRRAQQDLVIASRAAGMAEVATGVLHNVGNVLNSLNVSATLLETGLRQSKIASLEKLASQWGGSAEACADYLAHDPKGRLVPDFLAALAVHLQAERERLLGEVDSLQENIDHIKAVVMMQQNIATVVGVVEALLPQEMMENAARMTEAVLNRPGLVVERIYATVPAVCADGSKVLQILVNLIRNARHALDEGAPERKVLTLRIEPGAAGFVRLVVADNGVGIAPENRTRIFQHGFTTRKDGHGFGLHSAVNAAHEMHGSLTVHSEGPGQGARFTLELPVAEAPRTGAVSADRIV